MSRAHDSFQLRAESRATLDYSVVTDLWNRAAPDDLPTSARLLAWAMDAQPPRNLCVWIAWQDQEPVGFVVASHLGADALGWVDALAVPSRSNRAAVRTELLAQAATWLQSQGCTTVQFGGGPRSLMRGAPDWFAPLQPVDFFERRGFSDVGLVSDMVVDLARYTAPADAQPFAGVVRPANPRDRDDLVALISCEAGLTSALRDNDASPGSLLLVEDTLRKGRLADFMLLWSARGLEGLCLLVFADSATPIDLAYPYGMPRPWAVLGPVLIRADAAPGAADMLLDASLRRLHNTGANSAMAMGVSERALFARYGFKSVRNWRVLVKRL